MSRRNEALVAKVLGLLFEAWLAKRRQKRRRTRPAAPKRALATVAMPAKSPVPREVMPGA